MAAYTVTTSMVDDNEYQEDQEQFFKCGHRYADSSDYEQDR